jgi:hypothetical protein
MPEKQTLERARRDRRAGKAASTQAGEFVREEIHHVREGKHGARSAKQAIAIGLSKARRAGVKLPAPPQGASRRTKQSAASASRAGAHGLRKASPRRSRAVRSALKQESRSTTSSRALSKQATSAARKRSPKSRSAAAKKAARTKGPAVRHAAAQKAARTRRRHASSM